MANQVVAVSACPIVVSGSVFDSAFVGEDYLRRVRIVVVPDFLFGVPSCRAQRAELIARSKAEYLDADSK